VTYSEKEVVVQTLGSTSCRAWLASSS